MPEPTAEDPGAALIEESFDFFNEAFAAGRVDRERLAEFWHGEAEHVTRFTALEGRAYHGLDGIAEFLDESLEQFERFDVDLERIVGEGERRVAIYRAAAQTRDTGIELEQRLGMQVEIRDGKLFRTKVFADPREALEASGLDPAEA